MAKVDRVRFNVNYYELGQVKYAAGTHYPVTEETKTRVAAGDAEQISVDMDPDIAAAEETAAEAEVAAERQATLEAETGADKARATPGGQETAAQA